MTWLFAAGSALVRFIAPVWKPLAAAFAGYIKGRRDANTEAAKDAAKRVEKGRKAVTVGRERGSPDDRVRDNDARW